MQIPIGWLVRISDRIREWGSEDLYGSFRRMDPVIAVTSAAITGYYWVTGGWFPAFQTAASIAFGIAAAMVLMPEEK
jgi:hypothetical protein